MHVRYSVVVCTLVPLFPPCSYHLRSSLSFFTCPYIVLQCLELSWIAILVVGLSIVIFITLMCAHFYNRLF